MKHKLLNKLWLRVGMIVAIMTTALSGTVWAETTSTSYVFTSVSWADSNSSWTSNKAGQSYQSSIGNGCVQVTSNATYSGAGATSKSSFTNITSIKVNAATTSKGVGNITVKVGDGDAQTICSLSKNTTFSDYELTFSPAVSGKVTFVVNCMTNSMYMHGITITTSDGGDTPPTPSNPTVSFGTHDNITLAMWDEDLNDLESGAGVAEGTLVYVTATPDFGYNVGTVSAVDANSNTVTLTENTGNWSFTMPSSNVTISATATADPSIITLWSEDFSLYSDTNVPSGGTYGYSCEGTGTKVYGNDNNAGGIKPELLVAKNGGSFTAVVPLNQASGTLQLKYKTNAKALSVSTTTDGISGGGEFNTKEEHTVTFTGVTTSMTSITIVFTATSANDNVRLDDIVLRGSAQAITVEAPTFSVNGGTYYTAQSVELSCATDGATIYYTTNGDEPTSSSTQYTGAITVDQTMTIKAIAIKGGDQSTVSSATYTILEKSTPVILATKSIAYGSTYTLTRGTSNDKDVQTDGYVTLTSNNTSIATVSGLTITPVAVGTTTIDVSVTAGDTYNAGSGSITITVTAPEGQTTAPSGNATLFKETFDSSTGTNANFGNTGDAAGTLTTDNDGWSYENDSKNGANGAAKFGAGSKKGGATTPSISSTNGTAYTLTFKAAPWADEETAISVEAEGATVSGISTDPMSTREWNNFTATVTATSSSFTLTFSAAAKNRFFLDEVELTDPNAAAPTVSYTIPASGLGTFCSEYPLQLSNLPSGVKAYVATSKDDNNVTLTEITTDVKGGVGLVIAGTAGTINIPSVNCNEEPATNLLVGTLAPKYLAAGTAYGLKSGVFQPNSAGTINANRAYLPVGAGAPVKALTLVFEDDATGISLMEDGRSKMEDGAIYNLAGQRLNKMQKGINIVNGKKILK